MVESLTPDEIALLDSVIAESMPSVQPPAAARERIIHLVGELSKAPVSGSIVTRDDARGTVSVLVRLLPGAVLKGHSHRGAERSYVVSGSCRVGETRLHKGDFHTVQPGEGHGDIVSEEGCVLLVTGDQRDLE